MTNLVIEFHYMDGDCGAYPASESERHLWSSFSGGASASHIVLRPNTSGGQALSDSLLRAFDAMRRAVSPPMEWKRTADGLPTTVENGQVRVLFYTPGWAIAINGLYTYRNAAGEWWEYNQYHDVTDKWPHQAPVYWAEVTTPGTKKQ